MGNIFDTIFVIPLLNVLVAIYQLLSALHIPGTFGFSVILLTVLIRLLLYPFTNSQLSTSKKMQRLSPHLAVVKEKHKGDPRRLQQETLALYKSHGINPAAGCLPTLVQLPIIFGLWTVLTKAVGLKQVTDINNLLYIPSIKLSEMWDTAFFGIPLELNPQQLLERVGFLILLIPVLTGVLQFIQSRQMFSKPKDSGSKPKQGDFATAFQTQSLYIFPLLIGYFSFTFPVGLSLYWNTFSVFGIIQSHLLTKKEKNIPFPLLPSKVEKRKGKKK